MLFPVRCFTCGKVIASYEENYKSLLKEGVKESDALNTLKINRICCRRMFLCHVDIIDKLLLFPNVTPDLYRKKNSTDFL